MKPWVCVVSMWRKLCTKVKTLKVVYYKNVEIINHTRCNTVHLASLTDIGNIRNLKIIVGIFESQNQYAHVQNIWFVS